MRAILILAFVLTMNMGYSQDFGSDLVTWTTTMNEEGSAVELSADIKPGWVIYSQHTASDGPIPLEFEFTELGDAVLDGEVEELTKPIVKVSEMFDVEVSKFKTEAKFLQKLKTPVPGQTIKGTVTYMTCDDEKCLPPRTIPFQVN